MFALFAFPKWISNYGDWKSIGIVGLILLLLFLYIQYAATGYIGQRRWPVPTIKPLKEMSVFTMDKVMNKKDLFTFGSLSDESFPEVFKDKQRKQQLRKEAVAFFKKQYGFSDMYLNLAMKKVRVNDAAGYKVSNKNDKHITDGGYIVFVPPGKRLYGNYGGTFGVTMRKSGIIPFGYYLFGQHEIKYFAICPMASTSTYDGDYTLIDCDVEITKSPNPANIGLKGKAQGMQKSFKLNNGLHHIVVRNVLTFTNQSLGINTREDREDTKEGFWSPCTNRGGPC